jgi:hypothetical protein
VQLPRLRGRRTRGGPCRTAHDEHGSGVHVDATAIAAGESRDGRHPADAGAGDAHVPASTANRGKSSDQMPQKKAEQDSPLLKSFTLVSAVDLETAARIFGAASSTTRRSPR